jgi:hypothetical protein
LKYPFPYHPNDSAGLDRECFCGYFYEEQGRNRPIEIPVIGDAQPKASVAPQYCKTITEGIVKSSMKNRSGTYGKTRKTLPLEGGGKRVGVERPDGRSNKTQETLYGYRATFMEAPQRETERRPC